MGLYHNIIHWDWDLAPRPEISGETGIFPSLPLYIPPPNHPTVGECCSFIKYPFGEYNLDPVFKIKQLYPDFTADIEVLYSKTIPIGTTYNRQSLGGLRRVKLSTIQEVTSSAYSASTISPQPIPIQILTYKKDE